MYKLTILFFLLTTIGSQSLMDNCKIIFNNENASYTLNIDSGSLRFENNQPDVMVVVVGDDSADTDKAPLGSAQEPPSSSGKIYKVTSTNIIFAVFFSIMLMF